MGESPNYPRHATIRGEFEDRLLKFRRFVAALGAQMQANLWEVSYINHVQRGKLWENASDWHKFLPGLLGAPPQVDEIDLVSCGGQWRFHVGANATLAVRVDQPANHETPTVRLRLTARGKLASSNPEEWLTGVDRGREAIVRAFAAIVSREARDYWGVNDE
jgi:hypothetical protein